ncbi:flagellin [Halarcobacter ebronensis]|uniref:Flagellin n=1 Tax=Halarcobacter ebronensis TaxID=1462615 RepID=A0A4Q1AYV1_9BACT|nr:flagellin [Halarcobacter ebronensis]QKF82904.1 FlaG family protein [Halarcobacter ebronensis]RXK06921.1 flagellin [Halarcobacter ebronensis]
MELGKIAEIDNAQTNHIKKIQTVQEVDENYRVVDNEEHKKAQLKITDSSLNEVILDNVKFGYNKSSKDLFVKVIRGDAEYKYPTEDMMRIKAQLLKDIENTQKKVTQ